MSTPIQRGIRPRRFRTPDFKSAPIPDSILNDDGTYSINPEWEADAFDELSEVEA